MNGLTVGTLGGNPICYVSDAEKAIVEAVAVTAEEAFVRARAAVYARILLGEYDRYAK